MRLSLWAEVEDDRDEIMRKGNWSQDSGQPGGIKIWFSCQHSQRIDNVCCWQ